MIKVTINGKEIELEQPVTILEAARGAGIKIPTLCHHDWLKMYGGCRLCLVEIEKMPRLQPACSFMMSDGMVVTTESEQISTVRRGILEFILINHPLDCPVCDKAGECELQDAVYIYGPSSGRFKETKITHLENNSDPVIARNMERCIACTRCVRMCENIQGAYDISMINRGDRTLMEPFSGDRFDCEYCGNCITVCPVGSILSRPSKSSYRPWQMDDNITTVCGYCGVGCSFDLQVRDETIKKVIPVEDSALRSSSERFGGKAVNKSSDESSAKSLNRGLLCALGRFGYEYVDSKERLTSPRLRKNGKLVETSWDEALDFVVSKFNEIKKSGGGSALAGIASPRCTNEDNYVFQKFMRGVLGTNNIDSTARLGFAGAQAYLESLRGQGITANPIAELENSDVVLVVGGDPTVITPVLGLQIRAAAGKGAKIITLGPASGLDRCNPIKIIPNLFTENKVLERLSALLLLKKEKKEMSGELPAFEEKLKATVAAASTEEAEIAKITGVAEADVEKVVEILAAAKSLAVVIGSDIVQRANGHCGLFFLAGISYQTAGRIFLLSDRPNEQGLIDMGCLPDTLPGGRPLASLGFRKKYEETCGVPVPSDEGLTLFSMFQAISEGQIKGLYVMGENPIFNLPGGGVLKSKIENLELLVVQDIFLTETAAMADVVFPALSWAEREGTYTNLEHRIQMVRCGVKNIGGKEDWRIIAEISGRMGTAMKFSSAADVMAEIVRVSPVHRDLRYPDIEKGTMLWWPYKGEPSRSEASGVVHGDMLKNLTKTCGRPVESLKVERQEEEDGKGKQGNFALFVERSLFYSGTTSRKAPALSRLRPEAVLRVHPEDAAVYGITDGCRVRVSSLSAEESLEIEALLDSYVPRGAVKLPGYLEGRGAFNLTANVPVDPVTKAPALEECRVTVEAV